MAYTLERKNPVSIVRDFRNKIENRTNVNSFGVDSKARNISELFGEELVSSRDEAIAALNSQQIRSARGENLDRIGDRMGLPRYSETFAFSERIEQNFAFYTTGGTFGSINGGVDIVIPTGTELFSRPNENELNTTIRYVTTTENTLPAGESLAYVSVRATSSGSRSNIGSGVIQAHGFTGYVDSANDSLKAVNFYSVLNGRERERDEQYRFRLLRRYDKYVSSNESKNRLEALDVPGVLDIRVIPGYYGIGTSAVVVLGADNQSNGQLISAVQSRIDRYKAIGLNAIATPAVEVQFDLELKLKATRSLSASEKRRVAADVRTAAFDYFRAVGIQGAVSFSELARAIQQRLRNIIQLNASNSNLGIFKNIYVRKGYSGNQSSDREKIVAVSYGLDQIEYAEVGTITMEFV